MIWSVINVEEEHLQLLKSLNVTIGSENTISTLTNIYGCSIGSNCKIGPFVEIQKNVVIGSFCKVSSHSFLCEGLSVGDGVFIGHGVMFTNDRHPRAINNDGSKKVEGDWFCEKTKLADKASIGSGSVILPGISIGVGATVGAGSVVTKDVADGQTVAGNPARIITSSEI